MRTGAAGIGLVSALAVGLGVTQASGWPARQATPATASRPAPDAGRPEATRPDAADAVRPGRTVATRSAAGPREAASHSGAADAASTGTDAGAAGARITDPDAVAAQVLRLVNAARAQARCAAVAPDRRLRAAARARATDMAARRILAASSATGEAPWEQAWAQGYYSYAGTAIARGQRTAHALVTAWLAEPGSRSVILDCGSKVAGVAVRSDGNGPWWTAMFGHRAEGVN